MYTYMHMSRVYLYDKDVQRPELLRGLYRAGHDLTSSDACSTVLNTRHRSTHATEYIKSISDALAIC